MTDGAASRGVPDELIDALATDDRARAAWRELPPAHQREYIDWIVEAERPATRQRRATQAVMRLTVDPGQR
jgi:uncharacterized protein YdeI (YjbR/CyaY-like superfamily)